MVSDSLRHRDGRIYRLDAYCIMSNHVHVVFAPFLDERDLSEDRTSVGLTFNSRQPPLDAIMHSLKSFTAQEANKLIGRVVRFGKLRVMIMSFARRRSFTGWLPMY